MATPALATVRSEADLTEVQTMSTAQLERLIARAERRLVQESGRNWSDETHEIETGTALQAQPDWDRAVTILVEMYTVAGSSRSRDLLGIRAEALNGGAYRYERTLPDGVGTDPDRDRELRDIVGFWTHHRVESAGPALLTLAGHEDTNLMSGVDVYCDRSRLL